MRAEARIVLDADHAGRLFARELVTPAPLGARLAGGELHLLGTAAGPLGGDRLRLTLELRPGVRATVRSVAAAVAQRGDGSVSRHDVEVAVGADAHLAWEVQPLVAAAGCHHEASATVRLAPGASVVWRDELVLGRSGEPPGRCTSTLRVVRDGGVVLHHALSTATPGWSGPAVTAGAKVIGQRAVVGCSAAPAEVAADGRSAWLHLEDDVGLAVSLVSAGDPRPTGNPTTSLHVLP
jgi:urease accessory protein